MQWWGGQARRIAALGGEGASSNDARHRAKGFVTATVAHPFDGQDGA
jgi:hypothetical protein